MHAPRIHPRSPARRACVLVVLALAGCGQGAGQAQSQGAPGSTPPTPVTVQSVKSRAVLLETDYTARIRGAEQSEVRARVGGILEARLYEEGAEVGAGTPLFQIDPVPFRIAVQRAEAELATAAAELSQARREWRRIAGLFEQAVASERERDLALSARELAEARVAQAEAGLARAELELGYATVRAPLAGVTGLEAVTPGNLLQPGDLLTTVTQLDPVQARFSLPADAAAARRIFAAQQTGEALEVTLAWPDGRTYSQPGRIEFLASTVDPATGTVVAQALFPNPDRRLRPGETVRVRLATEQLEGVFVLPPQAVSQGPQGAMVFVVAEGSVAEARVVELGPVVADGQVVVGGLREGDRVVVNGQVSLRDGAAVNIEAPGDGAR